MKKLRNFMLILAVSIGLSHQQSFTLPRGQTLEGLVLGTVFTASAAGFLAMSYFMAKTSMEKDRKPKDKLIDRIAATTCAIPPIALWLMNMTLIPAPRALNRALEGFLVRNFFSPRVSGPLYKPGNR